MTEDRFETALHRLVHHFEEVQEALHLTDYEMHDIADIIKGGYE